MDYTLTQIIALVGIIAFCCLPIVNVGLAERIRDKHYAVYQAHFALNWDYFFWIYRPDYRDLNDPVVTRWVFASRSFAAVFFVMVFIGAYLVLTD